MSIKKVDSVLECVVFGGCAPDWLVYLVYTAIGLGIVLALIWASREKS